MEQSDQPQQSDLNLKRQEATIPHESQLDASDIAAMRDFIEFLAELKEAQEKVWRQVGYDPKASTLNPRWETGVFGAIRKIYPENYTYSCDYPEGQYVLSPNSFEERLGSRIWVEENCLDGTLRLLTKLIQGAMKGASTFRVGVKVLSIKESEELLLSLSIYLGFYNFILHFDDGYVGQDNTLSDLLVSCRKLFSRLWEPVPFTADEWSVLQTLAKYRIKERLKSQLHKGWLMSINWNYVPAKDQQLFDSLKYRDWDYYSYTQPYQAKEIDTTASRILSGESARFKRFVESLQGTVRILSHIAETRKLQNSAKKGNTDILSLLQSLFTILTTEAAPHSVEKPSVVEGTLAASSTTTATVKKVEQRGLSHIYHIELTDPGILPEPYEFTVTYNEGSTVEEVSLQEAESDE